MAQGIKGTGSQSERMKRYRENTCSKEQQTIWRQEWRARNRFYLGPKRQEMTDRIESIKVSTPCVDCGRKFPACCMDFDHVRGEKIAGVSELVSRSRDWAQVAAEMAKCDLVCACCHRIRTRGRFRATLEKDEEPKGKGGAS